MKQKYLLLSLILFVFLVSITSLSVLAVGPNLELTPSTQSVNLGSQANINVVVENVTELKGASITINFDASKLQYNSSADGGFIPGAFLPPPTVDNINGSVTLDLASLSSNASGTGTIMIVTFDTIGAGNSTVTFGATTLRDKNNIDITHTKGSGCLISIDVSHVELMPELQCVDQGQATVSVEVEDVVNLLGASITLDFEPTQLQYTSSADGGFIPNATLLEETIDNTNGIVTLDIAGLGTYDSGNGTIMIVTFDTIGAGNVIVTFGTTILRDKDNNEIVHTVGNGSIITINPPLLNLSPITQCVPQGFQATINLEVEDAVNLKGANITLNFDPTQLQYTSSADGGFIPTSTLLEQTIDNTNGIVTLDIVGLGATAYASGNGILFSIIFDRIDTGTTNITFGSTNLRDKNNTPICHTNGDGCTITSLLGDFGGPNSGPPDGVVDFEDLMIFAMAYGSTPADANWNLLCDIYPDGVIDFEDLMIFAMNYGKTSDDA